MRSLLAPLAVAFAFAKPSAAPPPPPLAPLPMLPSVGRVKIAVQGGSLVVVEEVTLPRGEWKNEPLDFHIAFGAPGAPRAIDAHLVPIADGGLEADDADAGEALAFDRVPRRPPTAHALLGRDQMAGIVVHLRREALAAAFAPGNMAALRIRTALELPELDPQGGRSVLVRLGASRGTPLTLGRVVVASKVARAEARLCGPEADPHPLAVAPRPPAPAAPADRPIAPVLAVRHPSDDLCVRFWQ